ncbi:hypothetical protein [Niveibacterium sp.]|uniref:hypothetical protein n=1 Tax=Niveibacterium sp. TaxID=2017444 RepID=UPI0035AD9F9A
MPKKNHGAASSAATVADSLQATEVVTPAPLQVQLSDLIKDDDLARAFGCSVKALRKRLTYLKAPLTPVKLGAHDTRYRVGEIEAFFNVSLRGTDL